MVAGLYDPSTQCINRHTAFIYDRGGSNRFQNGKLLDVTALQWSRVMDGKSQAQLTIAGKKACNGQASLLSAIEPRRHELVIFRGLERVWEGPIVSTTSQSSMFSLIANDIIEYLDFTALSVDWPAPPVGPSLMVDRINQIINYELTADYVMPTNDGDVEVVRWENQDPPINVLPFLDVSAGVTHTTSATTAFQMTVGSHLANLGQSIGVNYTTVGRRLVVWDGDLSRIPKTLTEADFSGEFSAISDGSSFFTISHASSQQQKVGSAEIAGHAVNDFSYYGPWESIATTESAAAQAADSGAEASGSGGASQSALNTQARRALYGLYPVPVNLQTPSGSTVLLGDQLGINDLVAGTDVPIRATMNIRSIAQMQRLSAVTVKEDPSNEMITVTLAALGEVTS